MVGLNRAERRALLLGTALVVAGAGARAGLGPGPAAFRWEPDSLRAAGVWSVRAGDGPTGPAARASGRRTGPGSVREEVREGLRRAREAARPLAPEERIDPNRAGGWQLERLPGVGMVTARRILEERRRSGRFREIEDLDRVPGIGPVTLRRIAPHISLPEGLAPSRPEEGAPVDVNRAGAEELRLLPGVGPVLAGRIVESRRTLGRFRSIDDLLRVPGIGARRLEGLRERAVAR